MFTCVAFLNEFFWLISNAKSKDGLSAPARKMKVEENET